MMYALYANNGTANRPVGQVFLGERRARRGAADGAAAQRLDASGGDLRRRRRCGCTSTARWSDARDHRAARDRHRRAEDRRQLRSGASASRGLIDDVRVYNRALSGAEITADMAASASQP